MWSRLANEVWDDFFVVDRQNLGNKQRWVWFNLPTKFQLIGIIRDRNTNTFIINICPHFNRIAFDFLSLLITITDAFHKLIIKKKFFVPFVLFHLLNAKATRKCEKSAVGTLNLLKNRASERMKERWMGENDENWRKRDGERMKMRWNWSFSITA